MTEPTRTFAQDTIDVKNAHRFDEAALERFLHATVDGFAGPLRVKQFEGGQSNPTYLLQTPSTRYVLRRKPPGELKKSAHAVDREYRVMHALNRTDFPVPKALVLCEDPSVIGTSFFVMSHIPGRAYWDVTMPDRSPADRRAIVYNFVDTLARLHGFDVAAVGLSEFAPPGNYFERQVSRWTRQYAETATVTLQEMDELMSWLKANIPRESRRTVVHGDYSFNNVLIHDGEPRVAAVLDWEMSTLGDPLADLAYFTQPWFGKPGERSFVGRDLKTLGIPSYEEVRDRYCERTGRTSFTGEGFYRAFNAMKGGAILQGIIRRAMDGTNAGEMALSFTSEDVRAAAIRGLEFARKD